MKIYDVPMSELRQIAYALRIEFQGDDVSNSRGIRVTGRLVPAGDNPYQRVSSSPFGTNKDGTRRKVSAICWHGYRDFMREVFRLYPGARIQTAFADYRSAKDFRIEHEETGQRNIGSMMLPMGACDACTCECSGLIDADYGRFFTPYGIAFVMPYSVSITATNAHLWEWSHRHGSHWPCSVLDNLDSVACSFDSDGLVELTTEPADVDIPGDEFNAWSSDVLADIVPTWHTTYEVTVGQFKFDRI